MDTIKIELKNLEDTERLGNVIGCQATAGDLICLDGDLGAGKTALSQAIARGLGVPDSYYVTSPSFTILQEYQGRIPMYHMDFYRLQDAGEVEDLGFEEYFYLDGLTVIEWSTRAIEILPDERMTLEIILKDDLSRVVSITGSTGYREMFQHISRSFQQ